VWISFFVDDVKSGIGLSLFGPTYWAFGPNVKAERFVSVKKN